MSRSQGSSAGSDQRMCCSVGRETGVSLSGDVGGVSRLDTGSAGAVQSEF